MKRASAAPASGVPAAVALVLAVALAPAMGCKRAVVDDHDHDHGHGHGEPGSGHGHDQPANQEPARPTLSVTVYESGLEVFMEYPALVVGHPSPLVAHFTDARDARGFKAVTSGRVTAVLARSGGPGQRFVADKPLRAGIFKPTVTPTAAGEATLTLILESEQVAGTVSMGAVTVYTTEAAAIAAAPQEESGPPTVAFLKEQQWKTDYATAVAGTRTLQGGVRANGELKAVPGQAAELAAPVAGRLPVGERVPALGQIVKKGELLVRILPTALASATDVASVELEASRARAELGLAERELTRAQDLLTARAIPEKQVDAARVAHELAAARVQAADRQRALFRSTQRGVARAGAGAFELRSPIDGVVSFAEVMPGAVVEPAKHLVSVVNTRQLWLEARVFESEAPKVEKSPGAAFTVAGFDHEFTVDDEAGRRVAVGAVVDRATRTVPVVFELTNPGGVLKPGMFAKVTLYTGETVRGVAVPDSAVIDDNGKPTVFVMEGGESFWKRPVRTGVRSGGSVQILAGVAEGERVVSRGAYEMKLAAAAGAIPEHGHQH